MEKRREIRADPNVVALVVPAADAELRTVIAEQEAEMAQRYGNDDPGDPVAEDATFVLLRVAGQPVGCVGIQSLQPGVGEIKRMYVAPTHRRKGLGRLLLREAERAAVANGYQSMRLQTGDAQPEAVALYASSGWNRIAPFGYWKDSPQCICFEKHFD